jgi:hypothetical protein
VLQTATASLFAFIIRPLAMHPLLLVHPDRICCCRWRWCSSAVDWARCTTGAGAAALALTLCSTHV